MTTTKRVEHFLSFDGVDDYVQAQNNTDLDFAVPIRIDFEFTAIKGGGVNNIVFVKYSSSNDWMVSLYQNVFGIRYGPDERRYFTPSVNTRYLYEVLDDGGDLIQVMNGVEFDRRASYGGPGPNPAFFRLGNANVNSLEGKIYSFQIGTETFPMNEGTGTTITGSEGTVLDIYGATWGSQII